MKLIRFTRGSRKHRVGRKSAYHVIAMTAATITTEPDTGDTTLSWVDKPDCYLVIHVMPTHYRREGR